jgi:hypothetical protein
VKKHWIWALAGYVVGSFFGVGAFLGGLRRKA